MKPSMQNLLFSHNLIMVATFPIIQKNKNNNMVYVQFMLSELRPFFNLKNNQLLISLINIAKDNIFLNIYALFVGFANL